jgi:hypothetical protein
MGGKCWLRDFTRAATGGTTSGTSVLWLLCGLMYVWYVCMVVRQGVCRCTHVLMSCPNLYLSVCWLDVLSCVCVLVCVCKHVCMYPGSLACHSGFPITWDGLV